MQKWPATAFNNPITKDAAVAAAYMPCVLRHCALFPLLRFLLISSHAAIASTGENETILQYLFSCSSSSPSSFPPVLIRLGMYPSLRRFFSSSSSLSTRVLPILHSRSLARSIFCLCASDERKKVFSTVDVVVVVGNDSRSSVAVIFFFIPESLLAKSC